jgi:dGTPase
MSDEVMAAINELRDFMFENVYALTNKSMQDRAERMLTQMFEYFMSHVDELPKSYLTNLERDGKDRVVCDYISGMSDEYAVDLYTELFVPKFWK